jgi:hypothetical protein
LPALIADDREIAAALRRYLEFDPEECRLAIASAVYGVPFAGLGAWLHWSQRKVRTIHQRITRKISRKCGLDFIQLAAPSENSRYSSP